MESETLLPIFKLAGDKMTTRNKRIKKNYDVMKYIKWNFFVFITVVFLYFIVGEIVLPTDTPKPRYICENLDADWYRIFSDGRKESISIPLDCNAPRGEVVTVETTLPADIEDNMYLCFRNSKQDMNIYVDGVLRQEYVTGATRMFGKTGAVIYLFFPLEEEDSGKVLTLTTCTDTPYSGVLYNVYYGDVFGIWQQFFQHYGSELVIAFLTLILGVVSILGSIALKLYYHRVMELEYLGWGVFLVAVWLISNSVFRQLIFPNMSVVNDIAFYMVMLIPFPFILYMNMIQKGRYEKRYRIVGICSTLCFVISSLLHIFHIMDFTDIFPYSSFFCVFAIVVLGSCILTDIRKGYLKEYMLVAIGVFGACIAAGVQLFSYFARYNVFNGVTMALGLVFLLAISVVNTIGEIVNMEHGRQEAVSASEAKAKFLAHMSHEIRTPINAVLGMDAMILRESKEHTIREYALDIQNAGRNLLALVNDILDFSKIDSGKMELVCVEYDLSSMIHDIFNMISARTEAKDLKLVLSIDEKLPSRLYGDDVRIRQILVNLLNNAVKYTEKGTVSLCVSGTLQENKVLLHFVVADTGIGIRQEDIVKLFMEFERIEEKRNRNVEGTGLGMNITVQLLKMMGSSLDVESEYGVGSQFSFVLEQDIIDLEPVGNLEERIRKQTEEFSYEVAFIAPQATLLVVDDNSVNRKVFVNLLKETRVQIDEAGSGTDCLDMVRQKAYDVIFLDHMMPDIDGIEVLHRMRSWNHSYPCENTPVIALTANAIVGAKEMYLSVGFDAFLSKPIMPDKLEQLLLQLLPENKVEQAGECLGISESAMSTYTDSLDELPNIPGIKWDYAMLHTKDVGILWNTIVDFYTVSDTEGEVLSQLYQALSTNPTYESNDIETLRQYRIKIHSLKSSANMIGATLLGSVAEWLESAAKEERLEDIHQMTPIFLREWKHLKEQLSTYCMENTDSNKTDSKPPISSEEAEEAFALLIEAMENMDIDETDRIMQYLLQFSYNATKNSIITALQSAVTNLDVELVRMLIEQFTKN